MILERLEMVNFKSFRGPHAVELASLKPGLYYLRGSNEHEPALGSNGAGKSTIWEAWYWCLFGKTPRNLRAEGVSTWGTTAQTKVVVEWLQDGETRYSLARTWRPNSLKLFDGHDWREVTQETVQDLIRITSVEFASAYLMGQGSQHFFDLTPSQKLELLQESLGLSSWIEFARLASIESASLEKSIHAKDMEVARVRGNLTTLLEEQTELRELDAEFEKRKNAKIDQQRAVVSDKLRVIKELKKPMASQDELITEVDKKIEVTKEKGISLSNKEMKIGKEQEKLEHEQTQNKTRLNDLKDTVNRFRDIVGGVCPTCLQDVSNEYGSKQIDTDGQSKDVLDRKMTDTADKLVAVQSRYAKCCSEFDSNESVLTELAGERKRASNELVELDRELATAQEALKGSKDVLENTKRSQSDYCVRLEQVVGRIKDVSIKCDSLDLDKRNIERKFSATSYWVKGFKDIRLFLMDEAVNQLECEVNQALPVLGLDGWSIKFEVERQTKAKTISKGFTVMVTPPGRSEAVPWEAWSGGETQRLRLAGRIGVSSVIMSGRGLSHGVEVWDEPTQFLSEEGIDDLKTALARRAESLGIQIWLVDHRAYDLGGFQEAWTVKKTREGSVIIRDRFGGEGI